MPQLQKKCFFHFGQIFETHKKLLILFTINSNYELIPSIFGGKLLQSIANATETDSSRYLLIELPGIELPERLRQGGGDRKDRLEKVKLGFLRDVILFNDTPFLYSLFLSNFLFYRFARVGEFVRLLFVFFFKDTEMKYFRCFSTI